MSRLVPSSIRTSAAFRCAFIAVRYLSLAMQECPDHRGSAYPKKPAHEYVRQHPYGWTSKKKPLQCPRNWTRSVACGGGQATMAWTFPLCCTTALQWCLAKIGGSQWKHRTSVRSTVTSGPARVLDRKST